MFLAGQLTKGLRFARDDNLIKSFKTDQNGDVWKLESNDDTLVEEPSEVLDSKNFSIDVMTDAMEKRQNHHLEHSCGCPILHQRIEFDEGVFPSSYNAKSCDTNAKIEHICRFGYQCKEFKHSVLVLKSKAFHKTTYNIHELPVHFKKEYFWEFQVRKTS